MLSVRWFTLLCATASVGIGWARGNVPPPPGIWIVLAVYPLWGVAQQFLLNAILARNLAALIPAPLVVPTAATLFAISHAPDAQVMALTLPAGAFWTWAYRRAPNLWILGIAHGVLGTLTFYLILGRDPIASLLP